MGDVYRASDTKLGRDEMDPLNVVGEQCLIDYEKRVERRQLDWLQSRKLP